MVTRFGKWPKSAPNTFPVKQMPRARLVTFEKCGHKPMFEHPARYHEALRDFLRDKRSKS